MDDGQGEKKAKVIPIEQRKGRPKTGKGKLQQVIARHMIEGNQYSFPFDHKYHVYMPAGKDWMILWEHDTSRRIVREVGEKHIAGALASWCINNSKYDKDLCLAAQDINQTVRQFLMLTPKLPSIPLPFAFDDYNGLSFHKCDFMPDTDWWFTADIKTDEKLIRKYPILDFFRRCHNADELAAWIGSLFYRDSYMQQYVYLTGKGNDGKGALVRLLKKILGPAYHSDDPNASQGNRFWTRGLLGKRFVVFPDTNYSTFTSTGLMKSLTGGDAIRIEEKGGAIYSGELDCKIMVVSNEMASIPNDPANQRRCVLVQAEQHGGWSKDYEEIIQQPEQARFFVEYCMAAYRELCPDNSPIKIDYNQMTQATYNPNEEVEGYFDHNFNITPTSCVKSSLLMHLFRKDKRSERVYLPWLIKNRPVVKKQILHKGERTIYYLGIEPKNRNFDDWSRENISAREACAKFLPIKPTAVATQDREVSHGRSE